MASGQPTSKEKKYDRQLRLWGANGQQALESAHICLVNATATGCEVLKNLILPGIGKFTIVDNALVTEADLGVNFFLDEDCLGCPRAESAYKLLSELNPDVQGAYINDSISAITTSNPAFLSSNGVTVLLLCAPIPTSLLHTLHTSNPGMTILHVYSVGFIAALRIFVPEIAIVETHPDSLVDLRLYNPWEELSTMAIEATKDLELQSEHKHGHIPYALLLLHYLDIWKQNNGGELPKSYKEKNEFKKLVSSGMRTEVAGGSEENYEEAIGAVLKNVKPHEISGDTKAVFEDDRCKNLEPNSESFWIIARAVAEFVANPQQGNGLLPLSGGVPDMKAESKDYVKLQTIYRQKAATDLLQVTENVSKILQSLGRSLDEISKDEISLWCRHANYVTRIRYRSFAQEWEVDRSHANKIHSDVLYNPDSLVPIYVALRAYQAFLDDQFNSNTTFIHPGSARERLAEDTAVLASHAQQYLRRVSGTLGITDKSEFPGKDLEGNVTDWINELVRYGGGEIHNIASLAGGIVSQEAIKLITKQYVPVNNTVVFDGVGSKSQVLEL